MRRGDQQRGDKQAEFHLNRAINCIVDNALHASAELFKERLADMKKSEIAMEDLFNLIDRELLGLPTELPLIYGHDDEDCDGD